MIRKTFKGKFYISSCSYRPILLYTIKGYNIEMWVEGIGLQLNIQHFVGLDLVADSTFALLIFILQFCLFIALQS